MAVDLLLHLRFLLFEHLVRRILGQLEEALAKQVPAAVVAAAELYETAEVIAQGAMARQSAGGHLTGTSSSARMISLDASSRSSYFDCAALSSSSISCRRPLSLPNWLMQSWSSRRTSTSLSSSLRAWESHERESWR